MFELKYYIFDFDDNLLMMHTPLHFRKNINGEWVDIDIKPSDFVKIREKYGSNYFDNPEWKADPKKAFIEFGDKGIRKNNSFMQDSLDALKNKRFGPSWDTFITTLKEGRLFAIVTTRGHEPQTIRRVIEWIIFNYLTEEDRNEMKKNLREFDRIFRITSNNLIRDYLNHCMFVGIFSDYFRNHFNYVPFGHLIEKGKEDAIDYFVRYVRKFAKRHKKTLNVGYSDDDINFSNAAKKLFMGMEKSIHFEENFYVFDTSNKKIKGGVKLKI